jgi:cysteinyl-tRNA synthetase, unknown class
LALAAALLSAAMAPLSTSARAQTARDNPFKNAKTWAFQLKNLDATQQAKLAASPYDVIVIDSEDYPGGVERPLKREEVEAMKKKPDGTRRLVIAYFSVGEAESYRYYWRPEWTKKKPGWVGKENKEWKENFLVKYWEPTWQNIIFGNPQAFADRVIAQGFDGFYIDRADAYYYFGDNADVRQKMRDFIVKLTDYMRKQKPDVGILVQNAEELLDNKAYVAAIDGIAKEDLLFGITHREEHNKADDVQESTALLKNAQAAGKKIFVIEYLTRPVYIAEAKRKLDDLGFVMYTGPRGLGDMQDPNFIATAVATAATVGSAGAAAVPAPAKPSITERVKAKAKQILKKN